MNKLNKNLYSTIAFLAIIVALYSCKNMGNVVQVEQINFGSEIQIQQNLIFTFNTDLVADSMVNAWRKEEYLAFEPKVDGNFKWLSKNELLFSPTIGFEPATSYAATLQPLLTKYSEIKNLGGDSTVFHFHTPDLELSNVNVYWAKSTKPNILAELRVNTQFNYAVNTDDLTSKLKVNINKNDKQYEITSLSGASLDHAPSIVIQEQNEKYDNTNLILNIAPSLACVDSKHFGKKSINYTTTIPSKDNFQILNAEASYMDTSSVIYVYTNQQLMDNQNLQQLININPVVSGVQIQMLESGLMIKGKFVESQSYELIISKELRGIFNGKLKSDFSQSIVFGQQKPAISFISKQGLYLTSKGAKEVALRIINVPVVKVRLYKIYANNILSFLKSSGAINSYYDEYYDYDGGAFYLGDMESYGDMVYEKEYTTAQLRKSNGMSLINLNFQDINNRNGIYALEVCSPDEYWLKANKIISVSDIGMIVKESENQLYVFAKSIATTEPLKDIEITLVSRNNQEIIKGTTDSEGIAKFDNLKTATGKFVINMLTATSQSDFTYLHFEQTRTETSRFEVGGMRNNASSYQAYLYGDREIYRPGETVHTNTIIRDEQHQALVGVPIKAKLILPNGREIQSQKSLLNKQGSVQNSFNIPPNAVTGLYQVEIYTANDILLGTRSISIEEFMPDRIKVSNSLNKESFGPMDKITLSATAMNLFGTPAANRNYEVELSVNRQDFYAKGYEQYDFSLHGDLKDEIENQLKTGVTSTEGKLNETFDLPTGLNNTGSYKIKAFTSVFDESGRSVNQVKKADLFTQSHFLGIRNSDSYLSTQEPSHFELIALNKDGVLAKAVQANIEVIKFNWQTVLEKDYGSYRYVSQKKEQVMDKKSIVINGLSKYAFIPNQSGEYELRLWLPMSKVYVSKYFYAYGWGSTANNSFEVNKEGSIDIVSDKKVYQKGEKANLIFKTPFAGKLLVTVERDKVFKYYQLNTEKRSASLSIDMDASYLPNVYVTATVIKPIADNQIPLTVGHGFLPLTVESAEHKLNVSIEAAKQSFSKTKQRITILAGNEENVELTLAAVDEGILQLKNTAAPDPYSFFFQKRALQVNSYDIYPKLLPEFRSSSIGGDGYNLGDRVNPMSNKRVKPMAIWSGILHTNKEGKAYFDLNIPSFSGNIKLMAVAYKDKAYGAATANMIVADPIIISTSLPRFLSPSDSVNINITLSNTTNKNISGNLSIDCANKLLILDRSNMKSITVPANSEVQVQIKTGVTQNIGIAKLVSSFTSTESSFSEENEISIRPATTLIKSSKAGVVLTNTPLRLEPNQDYIAGTSTSKLLISKSSIVQFAQNLDELIEYPHGCIEQTVSKAFPQLYLEDLSKAINTKTVNIKNASQNIQEAINKIQSMQLPNGALSYWQGGYEESWWGSVYAAHFLIEAQKNGYEVSIKMMDKIFQYLRFKLNDKATEVLYYYDQNGNSKHKQIAAKEIFYSLYLLAIIGKQDLSLMNYYKNNQAILAVDSKFLLAMSYKVVGDFESYRKLQPSGFDAEKSKTALGGSYYSHIRDMALVLNSMLDNDPNHPQIAILSRHLSEQLKKEKYLSTQQMAYALLALGKLAKKDMNTDAKGELKSNGKKIADYKQGELIIRGKELNSTIEVSVNQGKLYYFYQTQGIPKKEQIAEEDSYLRVRRSYYSRSGNLIDKYQFAQNDLIIVKITLETTDGSTAQNVVVTDILPACFEVENSRITEVADLPWLKNQDFPEHSDFRDDRVHLYTTATKERKEYYYMLRAVSKGKFKQGPVCADAMYNGEYHSYNGAGVIVVR